MREIKFRAWNKLYNTMMKWGNLNNKYNTLNCLSYEHLEVMQYTGLKDKNDKEIYEGDIVEITYAHSKSIHRFKVYYDCENAYYSLEEIGCDNLDTLCGWSKRQTEIIGNIYENPNLLKEA